MRAVFYVGVQGRYEILLWKPTKVDIHSVTSGGCSRFLWIFGNIYKKLLKDVY